MGGSLYTLRPRAEVRDPVAVLGHPSNLVNRPLNYGEHAESWTLMVPSDHHEQHICRIAGQLS